MQPAHYSGGRREASSVMNKSDLTEQEIRSRYIRPALIDAGWQPAQIREEYYFTNGRMHITGQKTAVPDLTAVFM